MDITAAGAKPTRRMSADWVTGTAWNDAVVEAPAPARVRAALVVGGLLLVAPSPIADLLGGAIACVVIGAQLLERRATVTASG